MAAKIVAINEISNERWRALSQKRKLLDEAWAALEKLESAYEADIRALYAALEQGAWPELK